MQNSVLLPSDATQTVATLKAQVGNDLAIFGSAALVRSLHKAELIDRYTFVIHPLALGCGARMSTAPRC